MVHAEPRRRGGYFLHAQGSCNIATFARGFPGFLIFQTLSGILDKHRPLIVHGNGSTFDISIMENMYNGYEVKLPWHYTRVNCFRTFRRFMGKDEKVEKTGVAHNALDDARAQVQYIFKYYNPTVAETAAAEPISVKVSPIHTPYRSLAELGARPAPLNINIESLDDVIIEQIGIDSAKHAASVINPSTTEEGRRLMEEAYTTGAATWALKFEAASKKSYNLVKAFLDADSKLIDKDITTDLLIASMTEVRMAIEAIEGKNE